MAFNIDEDPENADWNKAKRPLDTIAAINQRAAKEKKDQMDRLIAGTEIHSAKLEAEMEDRWDDAILNGIRNASKDVPVDGQSTWEPTDFTVRPPFARQDLTPEEQGFLKNFEKSRGRMMTDQEINLCIEQMRNLGE